MWGENTTGDGIGVRGTGIAGFGVQGIASSGTGVGGSSTSGSGVSGESSTSYGVIGSSASGHGVYGTSISGYGVYGISNSSSGVYGKSTGSEDTGVVGDATGSNGTGVYGKANSGSAAYGVSGWSTSGFAGYFSGKVHVNGALSKSSGSFKIDHPLDPANKYLFHSFVESPDMKNVYDGVVVTDENGLAVVELPEWFETLNRDFRYQLTVIGRFAQAIVEKEIERNRFAIRTNFGKVKVSWQVTGIRQDEWANAHRVPVEELKAPEERGSYLHPELFGQPEEKSVEWAAHPEMMSRAKEERQAREQSGGTVPER